MLSYFLSVKKNRSWEKNKTQLCNFSELGSKYFLGFLAFLFLLWQTRPLDSFSHLIYHGHVHLLKPLVLSTTAWLKTPSLQVLPWTACPKNHFHQPLHPSQGRILQLFHYFFCLFLTITAETQDQWE